MEQGDRRNEGKTQENEKTHRKNPLASTLPLMQYSAIRGSGDTGNKNPMSVGQNPSRGMPAQNKGHSYKKNTTPNYIFAACNNYILYEICNLISK